MTADRARTSPQSLWDVGKCGKSVFHGLPKTLWTRRAPPAADGDCVCGR
uniref:Uncharacterized protein n=1 Tax=Anguilla anguilla TaxID=7936 RepID=A0A0E9U2L9_ANGAN